MFKKKMEGHDHHAHHAMMAHEHAPPGSGGDSEECPMRMLVNIVPPNNKLQRPKLASSLTFNFSFILRRVRKFCGTNGTPTPCGAL